MNINDTSVKMRISGLGGYTSSYVISIISLASMFIWSLLLTLLIGLFPSIRRYDWLVLLPYLLPVVFIIFAIFSLFYTVTLTKDTVLLSWLNIPIRRLPARDLKLFCTVGNMCEYQLCLTYYTVCEMSQAEEEKLLRNVFTKYDVPRIKKKSNYLDILAKKYLIRMYRSPLRIFRSASTIFIPMNPVVQQRISLLYPEIPYKNYTDIPQKRWNSFINKDTVPYLRMPLDSRPVSFQDNEIILHIDKSLTRKISLDDIRTIVRLDIFRMYQKNSPHHLPILFLSSHTPEEMSNAVEKQGDNDILRAYRYAEREAKRWTYHRDDSCLLHYTQENADRLRSQCINAQWIDISDSWILHHP